MMGWFLDRLQARAVRQALASRYPTPYGVPPIMQALTVWEIIDKFSRRPR